MQSQDSLGRSNSNAQSAVNDCSTGDTSMAGTIFSANSESPEGISTPLSQEQSPKTYCIYIIYIILQLQDSDGAAVVIL